MVKPLLVMMFALTACTPTTNSSMDNMGVKTECKTNEVRIWCKYTNRSGEVVCAKSGDAGFTIPCSFYEGL